MPAKITTVDEYLSNVPAAQAASLQDLREKILRHIPEAQEKIAFGKPFYYRGPKYVVPFAAAKAHNSFHTMSFDVAKKLTPPAGANWSVDGGSVKFSATDTLDESVVKDIIKLRLTEMNK